MRNFHNLNDAGMASDSIALFLAFSDYFLVRDEKFLELPPHVF
jgi:hypothetical protein